MLTGIRLNNWLAHRYADLALSPLTIIAGPNGSGKSSVGDAIAFGLTGEPRRVKAKGAREELLSEGSSKGSVELRTHDAALIRDITSGKLVQPAAILPEGLPDGLLDVLLAPARFARMADDARRTMLFQLAGVSLSADKVRQMLIERGNPEKLVKLMPFQGGISAWHKDAQRAVTEARGVWKGTTGEAYGSQKAEGWTAPVPEPIDGKDADELKEQITLLERAIATCNQQLGAITATTNAAPVDEEALRRKAGTLAAWQSADTEAHRVMVEAKAALTAAQAALAALPGGGPEPLHCPDCGAVLMIDQEGRGKHLVSYAATDPVAAQQARQRAEAAVTEAQEKLREAEDAAETANRRFREAQDAKRQLDRLATAPSPGDAAPPADAPEDIKARLADHQRAVMQAREDLASIGKHSDLVKRAQEKTAKAAAAHEEVKAWSKIADALAPDGIPAEVLGTALKPLNGALTELAAAAGWAPVAVGGDMAITVGGRAYGLLSESEQWRADALVAVALARLTQVGLVLLDRFDVLDLPSRGRALKFLFDVTRAGEWTVIVAGTFKAPPQVPPAIRVHWFGPDSMEKAA